MSKLDENVASGLRKQLKQLDQKRERQQKALDDTNEAIASLEAILGQK